MLDELQTNLISKLEPTWGKPAVEIKGNFSWGFSEKQEQPLITLRDLDLKIQEKELICVVGDVGSGKSSLLKAIAGEMIAIDPTEEKLH
jgi:ABC-type uncharacterized transport system ATPase component